MAQRVAAGVDHLERGSSPSSTTSPSTASRSSGAMRVTSAGPTMSQPVAALISALPPAWSGCQWVLRIKSSRPQPLRFELAPGSPRRRACRCRRPCRSPRRGSGSRSCRTGRGTGGRQRHGGSFDAAGTSYDGPRSSICRLRTDRRARCAATCWSFATSTPSRWAGRRARRCGAQAGRGLGRRRGRWTCWAWATPPRSWSASPPARRVGRRHAGGAGRGGLAAPEGKNRACLADESRPALPQRPVRPGAGRARAGGGRRPPGALLREVWRVLAPSGRVIVARGRARRPVVPRRAHALRPRPALHPPPARAAGPRGRAGAGRPGRGRSTPRRWRPRSAGPRGSNRPARALWPAAGRADPAGGGQADLRRQAQGRRARGWSIRCRASSPRPRSRPAGCGGKLARLTATAAADAR